MTIKNIGTTSITVATQKSDTVAEYSALVQGLTNDLPTIDTLYVDGVAFKKVDLITRFQRRLDAATATRAARTELLACVATEKGVEAEVDPLRNGTKGALKGILGKKSPLLQKFGFTPDRTPQKSAASVADAVTKAKATREARGTKGKKQAAAITAPVAAAPITEPAAPAAAPAAITAPVTKS